MADALAEAVVAEVKPGMIVGLGTGRTAARAVVALAERVRDEGLAIRCVPTSHVTETLARQQQLPLVDFAMTERVDLLFDGADEVDPQMQMLKGKGGAIVRERIVAWAAERRIYMINEAKQVKRLGTSAPLPIAVLAFGLASIRGELRNLGLNGVVRRSLDGHLFLTDNGSLVIDVTLGDQDLNELACVLNSIPGVLDHGLFLTEADEVLVEGASGITRLKREESRAV